MRPKERSTLSTVICSSDTDSFLKDLRSLMPDSTFYIEKFGCKNGLSHEQFYNVYIALLTIFDFSLVQDLSIDIANWIRPAQNKIIFPDLSLFDKMHVRPNYHLAFCRGMVNYNSTKVSLERDHVKYEYGCVTKLNFYSLLEDMLVKIRKINYLPHISIKRAHMDLEGYSHKYRLHTSYEELLGDLQDQLNNVESLGYRMEMTTEGKTLATVFNVMFNISSNCGLRSFNFAKFRKLYMQNLLTMKNWMDSWHGGSGLNNLAHSMVMETVLKEKYIKGTSDMHFLPSSINLSSFYRDSGMDRLGQPLKEALSLIGEQPVEILTKVFFNNHISLDLNFLAILKRFITIYVAEDPILATHVVLEQYMEDYTGFYDLEEPLLLNYNRLGTNLFMLNKEEGTTSLSFFLENEFLSDKAKVDKLPFRYMLDYLGRRYGMDTSDMLDMFYTVFKKHGLNIGVIHRRKGLLEGTRLVELDLGISNVGGSNKIDLKRLLDDEINSHLTLTGKEQLVPKNMIWTKDEKIRLVHGYLKYSRFNTRANMVKVNFMYGFYLSRPAVNSTTDGWNNLIRKPGLASLIEEAIKWDPSHYPIEDHFEHVSLNNSIEKYYRILHRLDSTNFKPVTLRDLQEFYENFLKFKKITNEEYLHLKSLIMQDGEDERHNEFRMVRYRPFSEYSSGLYIIEQRPLLADNVMITLPVISNKDIEKGPAETKAVYVTEEKYNLLVDQMTTLKEELDIIREELKYIKALPTNLGNSPKEDCNFDDVYEPSNYNEYYSDSQSIVAPLSDAPVIYNNSSIQTVSANTIFDNSAYITQLDEFSTSDSLFKFDESFILSSLLRHFKVKQFTLAQSLKLVYKDPLCRPSFTQWKEFILYLVSKNKISKHEAKNKLKFSLKKTPK